MTVYKKYTKSKEDNFIPHCELDTNNTVEE